jgi:hypothetical protein
LAAAHGKKLLMTWNVREAEDIDDIYIYQVVTTAGIVALVEFWFAGSPGRIRVCAYVE